MFLLFFALITLAWGGISYWPMTIHIYGNSEEESFAIKMPLKDKWLLEYFFRDICFLNEWAYTLVGSKPMSIHQYREPWSAFWYQVNRSDFKDVLIDCLWPPNFRWLCYHLDPVQLKLKLGWKTLNKYIQYFPDSRFVLYTGKPHSDGIVVLALVNKIKLLGLVREYSGDFKPILQKQGIEVEDLYDEGKLDQFLKELPHDGYFGNVLGYGRDNAWLFYEHRHLDLENWPMGSAWPIEEIENLEVLNQKEVSFKSWEISDLFYPRFACDPESEETKQLRRTYQKEREEIVRYFEGKDVVEATLSLFNQKLVDFGESQLVD